MYHGVGAGTMEVEPPRQTRTFVANYNLRGTAAPLSSTTLAGSSTTSENFFLSVIFSIQDSKT